MNRPERIYNVTQTQFSIARHYGGLNINGAYYHYDAQGDALFRGDIWAARIAISKEDGEKSAKSERKKWTSVQGGLARFTISITD